VIFGEELADLAERHPGLQLIVRTDDEAGRPLGFDEGDFAALVPDFAARTTYLCGPGALMERVEKLWHCAGASTHLSRERFAPPARLVGARAPLAGVGVRLARSERRVTAAGEGALLEQLERAGERPANGCRIGICHTCTCRKHSGTVENLLTGEVSSEPDQDIQLCISVPRSDLDLDL
jgi:ferredoxin